MKALKRRVASASVVTAAVLAVAPAAHAAGLNVTEVSSLPAGAKAGNLSGLVRNDGDSVARANITVRMMRRVTGGAVVGRTSVTVPAHGATRYLVDVKIPSNARKGTYYLA